MSVPNITQLGARRVQPVGNTVTSGSIKIGLLSVEEKQQTEDTVLEQDWTDLSQASFVQYQDLFVIMWLMM